MRPRVVRGQRPTPPIVTITVVLLAAVLCCGAGGGTLGTSRVVPGATGGAINASWAPAPVSTLPLGPAQSVVAAASSPSRTARPAPDTVFTAGLAQPVGRWENLPFAWPMSCPAGERTCPLRMDVYAPLTGGPWPLVVALPGGPADPTQFRYLQDLAIPLAARGAVVITAGWQMRPADGAGYPQSFEDVACAVGVARGVAAEYGASPDRVTLVGHSLGAWAAEVVALSPSAFPLDTLSCPAAQGSLRPDALVAIDGAPWGDFETYVGSGYLEALLGGDEASEPQVWSAVNPFEQLATPTAPQIPVLVIHGTADATIPASYSQQLEAALTGAGYQSSLVLVAGATHGGVLGSTTTVDAIAQLAGAG